MVRPVFIPSFGTDSSLFDALKRTKVVSSNSLYTEWLPVSKQDGWADYAKEFIRFYKINERDVLVGVSLGGVLAIEITKLVQVRKVIVISSIKTKHEKPWLFRFLQRTKTYKLFLPQVLKLGLDLVVPFYGKNVSSYGWFRRVFKASDNQFLKWALKQIVHWDNEVIPVNLVHIHGSRDPLFPINNSANIDHEIKDGTHAMIRLCASEIAEIISSEINYLDSV